MLCLLFVPDTEILAEKTESYNFVVSDEIIFNVVFFVCRVRRQRMARALAAP